MNWIAFHNAVVNPFHTTIVDFQNTTAAQLPTEVRFGKYKAEVMIQPGGIRYPLHLITGWIMFHDPGEKKSLEETVWIKHVEGLFVNAHIEHMQRWTDRKPENNFYQQLKQFDQLVPGEPPFGPDLGRHKQPGPETWI